MKRSPGETNELRQAAEHSDSSSACVTAVCRWPESVAQAVVEHLAGIVRTGHVNERHGPTPAGVIRRAQEFEEGEVYMLEPPFDGYFADRYLMDFYDVRQRDVCSRMHMHTGIRFVRLMTGADTAIRISSLSALDLQHSVGWTGPALDAFTDLSTPPPGESPLPRHNVVVPSNSWVDMQIPRGTSHQFNADGPNAVIDSVHPEESIETLREGMDEYRMTAQTIFLSPVRQDSGDCLLGKGDTIDLSLDVAERTSGDEKGRNL